MARLWQSPGIWVLVLLLSLYLCTAGGDLFVSDGVAMYRTTEALVTRHTLALAPDPLLPQVVPGWDGRWYSMYDLGQPLAAVPFYLAGEVLAHWLPRANAFALKVFCVSLLPQVATALAGVALYALARRLYRSRRAAAIVALLWGTGTLAWPYSKFYFAEALLTLCLVVAAWLLVAGSESGSPWQMGLAGASLGAAVAVRMATAVYAPAFLVYLALAGPSDREDKVSLGVAVRRCLFLSAGLLPGLALTAAHNYLRFHSLLQTGYEGQSFSTPLYTGLHGLLFSPGRSIFLYSPPALLGLLCLGRLGRRSRPMVAFSGVALVTVLLFYSVWWSWYGGWCWGPRFLVPILPFLVLPVGTLPATRRGRAAVVAAWAAGLLAAIPGVCVNFTAYIVDFMHGDYSLEPQMWFYPPASPLIGHWRYLLQGRDLILAGRTLSHHGLPRLANLVYWPGLGSVFALALGRLMAALRREE